MKRWQDISISRKLYVVIGTMGVLLAAELLTLRFAMQTLSAVRAFVAGEGSWSKAQKDATFSLQRFAVSHDDADFQRFVEALRVPDGDHQARIELLKSDPDYRRIQEGFIAGRIRPEDIPGMVSLLRRFYWVSYLARAIAVWGQGDELLAQLKQAGASYHALATSHAPDPAQTAAELEHIRQLNGALTELEDEFSDRLGEGSRWLERVVVSLLTLAVLTVEGVGLSLTFVTTRALSRGLSDISGTASRIGAGDFAARVTVQGRDEIGVVAEAINRMGALLEQSYRELEVRVQQRTAELRNLAAENARLYEQASAAVKMRDEFFSIASHELRSPLTALSLQLQLLERSLWAPLPEGPPLEKARQKLDRALRESRRLSLLSSQLLDLTRIRLGKLEVTRAPGDLTALVRDVVEQMGAEAAAAGSQLQLYADAPVSSQFDALRLSQVITNLTSNAIKYGLGNPIAVTVETTGGRARILVRDHGRGIAPEDQARIFERFERAEPDVRIAGLGLGLFITRQIVQAHQGTITVTSAVGEGSTFVVELPLNDGAAPS